MNNAENFTNALLLKLNEPDFVPTLVFEKRFVEIFCTKLNKINEAKSSGTSNHSIVSMNEMLDCVLVIAKKDDKFIPLFGIMDSIYEQIINSLRSELIESESLVLLHAKVLTFISLIIKHIPSRRATFVTLGLHKLLLLKPAVLNRDLVMLNVEILELLSDIPVALQDISSINALNLLFSFLEGFIGTNESGFSLSDPELLKSLLGLISKISRDVSLNNSNHLRKFDDVFLELARVFPELEETIQGVYKLVCEATLSCSRASLYATNKSPLSIAHSRISKQRSKVFQYSMSILEFKPTPIAHLAKSGRKSVRSDEYTIDRYIFIDMKNMDLEVDTISLEKSVEQISLETTAEVICGMLNSNKGGTIHFGISNSGRIEGVRVNHEQRDGLRCGLDNVFLHQLSPLLPSSLVSVNFIPVRDENTRTTKPNQALYVIRIVVPANMNTLYYLKNRNLCFVRRHTGNEQLNLKEVRQLTVSLSEKRFMP